MAPQRQTAALSYALPSRVAGIQVKIGDWVKKGQALVTLQSPGVADVKLQFCQATVDLEIATTALVRKERLSEDGIGLEKDLLAAKRRYEIARADAEAAEEDLRVLGFTADQVKRMVGTRQFSPPSVYTHQSALRSWLRGCRQGGDTHDTVRIEVSN